MATFVDLSCRRQGVGRRLFAATFEAARAKAYKKVFTYVRADNPAALACYLDHGFEVVGTAKKHAKVKGAYIDETIIERLL